MEVRHDKSSERGFEAVGWFLTAVLLAASFWLPAASARPRQALLLAITAAVGVLSLLARRLSPARPDGPATYRREDKALIISIGQVLLLALYLYALPAGTASLGYLFLLPMIGATLMLDERVVLAEALASAAAMLFLQAAGAAEGAFWTPAFAVQLAVFAAAAASLIALTSWLRRASADVERLSSELSRHAGQMQALGSLARQGELTPRLDELAARIGEIIADAIGSERHAIFVAEADREGRLLPIGEARGPKGRGILSVERHGGILRSVIETGVPRVFDGTAAAALSGDGSIRDMLALPLRARHGAFGVLCLVNGRAADGFDQEDVRACEALTGFAAGLLHGALLFRRAHEERRAVEQLAKLLVGRETRMREIKDRLREKQRV